jgi:uncharacterized protein (TIGR00255 family)
MTGYGNAEIESNGVFYSVEVRSLNSKFFEVSVKLPKNHSTRENEFREMIKSNISRGKISLSASIQKKGDVDLPIKINKDAVKFLNNLLKTLRKSTGLKEKIKLDHYLKFSEVFQYKEEELSDEEFTNLMRCAETAVQNLMDMKLKEGKELEKDIMIRLKQVESIVKQISKNWSAREHEELLRLREKANRLLEGKEIAEDRIEMELVFLLDKMDITEECVRLDSHIQFFEEAVRSNEAAGRKLGFLSQEMLRETNTIASKSSSAEISQLVVRIKEELEKIREQLFNIE